jgi:hypothetical protein
MLASLTKCRNVLDSEISTVVVNITIRRLPTRLTILGIE